MATAEDESAFLSADEAETSVDGARRRPRTTTTTDVDFMSPHKRAETMALRAAAFEPVVHAADGGGHTTGLETGNDATLDGDHTAEIDHTANETVDAFDDDDDASDDDDDAR